MTTVERAMQLRLSAKTKVFGHQSQAKGLDTKTKAKTVWKAVVDVPRNLQRVVIILQRVVECSQ